MRDWDAELQDILTEPFFDDVKPLLSRKNGLKVL